MEAMRITSGTVDPHATSMRLWQMVSIALIVIVGAALNLYVLLPGLPSGDEAGYLADGANLVEKGTVLAIGSGPLPSLVNGALDLPFRGDHLRLSLVSTLRRVLTYGLILAAVWWAARHVAGVVGGYVALVLAAVGRPVAVVLDNSADALYTALSALAFVLAVGLLVDTPDQSGSSKRWKLRAGAMGGLLGLSALARLDGLASGILLLGALIVIGLWAAAQGSPRRRLWRIGLYGLGGFAVPVVGWILLSGILRGNWDTQIPQRSYLAFEQAHNFLYAGRFEVPPPVTATDLYGSAAANHYSVLRAIAHNPRAFLARMPRVLGDAVRMYENAYSIVGGDLFFVLILGAGVYLATVNLAFLGLTALWLVPLLGYLLASYRPGFFGTVYPELLVLLAAAVIAVVGQVRRWWAQDALRPALFTWSIVLLLVLAGNLKYDADQLVAWARNPQSKAQVQWVQTLSSNLPSGSCLIAFDSTLSIYAGIRASQDWTALRQAATSAQLVELMRAQNCHYVLVDDGLRSADPNLAALVEKTLSPLFSSADGSQTVFSDQR